MADNQHRTVIRIQRGLQCSDVGQIKVIGRLVQDQQSRRHGLKGTGETGAQASVHPPGGSQSFNAVNQMRILGRWMRMVTIPNQSAIARAYQEFAEDGRMKPSSYYDRIVDVMEELVKFTLVTRDISTRLTDRYSERKEAAETLEKWLDLKAAARGRRQE